MWSLEYDGINPPVNTLIWGMGSYSVTSFGVDENDELYFCSFDGKIYRITRVNDPPTIAAVADPAAINEDAAEQVINLSGIGTGAADESQALTVTATSDNPGLIPDPIVTYTSPQATGSLS